MFITADQILAHLVGDYILQSDWMACLKRYRWFPAVAHALSYSLPFLLFSPSLPGWVFIAGSHLLIDRFGLARYLVWAKNQLAPSLRRPWVDCEQTGYPSNRPDFMRVWLMIIADNTLHIICNGLALKYL